MSWQFAEPTLGGAVTVYRINEDGSYESRSLDDKEVQEWMSEQEK